MTTVLCCRVSVEEKRDIASRARFEGLNLSDYVKYLIDFAETTKRSNAIAKAAKGEKNTKKAVEQTPSVKTERTLYDIPLKGIDTLIDTHQTLTKVTAVVSKFQVCPLCNGDGEFKVLSQKGLEIEKCSVCAGEKIIHTQTGLPPSKSAKV